MDTFGAWLRQQRTHLKLTREQFAELVGCSVSLLRKIEDGERRPSTQIAELMANSLNIPEADRATFVRVARGELNLERLPSVLKLVAVPIAPAPSLRVNLPVLPTPLIGRQREVAELSQLLRDPQCRLLSLVGPGGIGKTRLAIETASQVQDVFADGVYFVPLVSVNSTRLIVPVMADALGFPFQSASSVEPKTQLFNYLKEKYALLVVDNLEHLLAESGIEVLAEILASAPQVKLLTTSRESLGLLDEWIFEVQGLPIPESRYVEGSAQNTSVELFLQRARRAHVGFDATPEDYPAIVRICQLMDGMPLGIELAAAWVRTLSCVEIAREIERGLDFLSVSTRDLPARHRSMRAVFDHSWKFLTEEEKQVLARLSVFRGGFRREAAEQVAVATLSVLSMLVTKSLIRRSGDGRYDLHELIRQFAAERFSECQEVEQTAIRARHSSYYLTYIGQAEGRLRSSTQRETLAELTTEIDNILAAWDWAIKKRKYELITRTARSIGWFFEVAGLFHEGIEQLQPLVKTLQAEMRNDELNRLLGLALLQQGLLYFRKGQFVHAEGLYKDSIAILRPIGDQALLADALTFLGIITYLDGEYAQSRDLLREGLECARASNAEWFEAYAIYSLGYIDSLMGDYKKGYEQMLVGVDMWRAIGDPHYIALGLNFLVPTIIKLGHYEEAKAFVWESITLCEKAKNRWGMGTAYRYLGSVNLAEGQYAEAQAHFRKSLEVFGEYTEGWDVALSLYYLGEAAMIEGNLSEARKNYLKALRISFDANSIPIAIDSLLGLAQLYLQDGELERVLELSYYILNHPSSSQETKDGATHLRAELESQLTKQQVGAAWARAQAQPFETVVHEVLKQTELT